MSHDELRTLVPPYAAGTLTEPEAESFRAHLATGCTECLERLYSLPVGEPRALRMEPSARSSDRTRRLVPVWTTLAIIALALSGWGFRQMRAREVAHYAVLAAVEADRADLRGRLERVEGQLRAARDLKAVQTNQLRITGRMRALLARQLADAKAALMRAADRSDGSVDLSPGDSADRHALTALLDLPGLQVVVLEPTEAFRDVRGYVLWNPEWDTMMLYAFGLPGLSEGTSYRVRLSRQGKPPIVSGACRPDAQGDAVVPIHVASDLVGLKVQVVVAWDDPPPALVLTGRPRS